MFSLYNIWHGLNAQSFNYRKLRITVEEKWNGSYEYLRERYNFPRDTMIGLVKDKYSIPWRVAQVICDSILDKKEVDEWSAPYSTKSKLRNVFIGVAIDAVLYPALYLAYSNLRDYYYQSYIEYLEDCGKVTTGEVVDQVKVSAFANVSVDIAGNTSAPENLELA